MFSKFAAVSVLALFFAVVIASPQPTPGPADPVEAQRRQIDSVISQVTGGGASIISDITSAGGGVGTVATSLGGALTSNAASIYSAGTSAGGSAATGNSGTPMAMMSLQTPLLAAFTTIIFSTLFGAVFIL